MLQTNRHIYWFAMVIIVSVCIANTYAGLKVGTPAVPKLYPYQPANYDGPIEQPIRISAARRENEPFMLYLIAGDKPLRNVTLRVSPLTHRDGSSIINVKHIEVAPLAYVKTAKIGSTDPSLAGETLALKRRRWKYEPRILRRDITRFNIDSNSQQAIWGNVYVPPNAKPGDYRGTVSIRCEGTVKQIPVQLTVYSFTLPEVPSMPAYTHWSPYSYDPAKNQPPYHYTQDDVDKVAKFIIRYRWRVGRIYQNKPDSTPLPTVKTVKRWKRWGGRDINLLRIDFKNKSQLAKDPNTGKWVFNKEWMDRVWKLLDHRIDAIKKAGLLDACCLYGFDERPLSEVNVISDTFGRIKKRYGNIKTIAVSCEWNALDAPELKNVDVMGYITYLLCPELVELHHRRGEKIIWYNISRVSLVPARVQFWATYKDHFDGVLFYNMRADAKILQMNEKDFPLIDKEDMAPMQYLPDGPTSTTILEMWREGLEDADYLNLLAQEIKRVKNLTRGRKMSDEVKKLLALAEYYSSVPDTITFGKCAEARISRACRSRRKLLGRKAYFQIEASLLERLSTQSMKHIMYVRSRIAELIIRLGKIENTTN